MKHAALLLLSALLLVGCTHREAVPLDPLPLSAAEACEYADEANISDILAQYSLSYPLLDVLKVRVYTIDFPFAAPEPLSFFQKLERGPTVQTPGKEWMTVRLFPPSGSASLSGEVPLRLTGDLPADEICRALGIPADTTIPLTSEVEVILPEDVLGVTVHSHPIYSRTELSWYSFPFTKAEGAIEIPVAVVSVVTVDARKPLE